MGNSVKCFKKNETNTFDSDFPTIKERNAKLNSANMSLSDADIIKASANPLPNLERYGEG